MTASSDHNEHRCFSFAVARDQAQAPLRQCVETALQDYFRQLDGQPTTNLYQMLLAEVEAPLFKTALEYARGNQSRAARMLGINRATLRKKIKIYGL